MTTDPPLHIVLVEPKIPPNTGNIARSCACTGCHLHLIHPLGFSLDNKQLRRAGLDYWQYLDVFEYPDWATFRQTFSTQTSWYALTTKSSISLWDVHFKSGDVLVFGSETKGLHPDIVQDLQPVRVPMRNDALVRSLNLSSACAIVMYEGLRQVSVAGDTALF
ncbi:MAG: tRNA (cytidine(34)-2'-O)-methyltransferase [Mariprofundaceae bacterium]